MDRPLADPAASAEPRRVRWVAFLLVLGLVACSKPKPVASARVKVKDQACARAAAAPRPPPPPPRAADGSYTVGGLRYLEYVTGGANPNDALPMIVVLHGHGGDPNEFTNHFKSYPGKARVIAPFGFERGEHGGYQWFAQGISHHDALRTGELDRVLPRVADRLSRALAVIHKTRPSVGKIVVTGFSQGGVLTYGLALHDAEAFSVACPMSGTLPRAMLRSSKAPAAKPEVHGFHGDADKAININDAQNTVSTLKRLGFTADLKVYRGLGHDLDPAMPGIMGCLDRGVRMASATPTGATPTAMR